jgi:hypothetical protein
MSTVTVKLDKALIETFAVTAAVLQGQAVLLASATTCTATTTASGLATHIALDAGPTAGDKIRCVPLGTNAIVPCLVGTGGCTINLPAVATTNGATDVTLATVTGAVRSLGLWRETGVAGDYRPLYVCAASYFRAPAS